MTIMRQVAPDVRFEGVLEDYGEAAANLVLTCAICSAETWVDLENCYVPHQMRVHCDRCRTPHRVEVYTSVSVEEECDFSELEETWISLGVSSRRHFVTSISQYGVLKFLCGRERHGADVMECKTCHNLHRWAHQ